MPDIAGGISGSGNLYSGAVNGSNPALVPTGGAFLGICQAAPAPSGIVTQGYPQGTAITGSTALTPAIQAIWSKEILFQAMPILRFEQFAVKKTDAQILGELKDSAARLGRSPTMREFAADPQTTVHPQTVIEHFGS